ncbi:MAG: efflux RND transporter periplasmic adaptor subunit [Cyclobacteriaceae bacterium]
MKSNKWIYYLAGVAVVLVVVAIIGKSQGWFGNKKPTEVEFAKVERRTIVEKVGASGDIQPEVEVSISPEVPGEIIELTIKEGDTVTMGQLLVKIRPDNFVSALERANANYNQQKANLADSRARLARTEAQFKRSELEFNRQNQLYEQQVISTADNELAEANFKIAQQDLISAKQNVIAADYIVKSAQASVDEAQENLRRTSISAPMSGTVSLLNVELGERVVGTSQMAGTELLRIADLSLMEVRVDVNENDIIRIMKSDTATIEVDSYSSMDKEFMGIVTQIANTANNKVSDDAVTEFEVRIRILRSSYEDLIKEKGISNPFKPGMTASVEIITETKENIITVPLSAVATRSAKQLEDDAKENRDEEDDEDEEDSEREEILSAEERELFEVVFIHENEEATLVKVKTGISDYEHIEILEGLSIDQEIISGPYVAVSKRLRDGDGVVEMEDESERRKND